MFLSILLLPFLGFVYSGFLGRIFGRQCANFFAIFFVFFAFFLSLFAFFEVTLNGGTVTLTLFS